MFVVYNILDMKKIYFLALIPFFLLSNWDSNSNSKEEVSDEELTNEEQLKKLYVNIVLPLFEGYEYVDIPIEFKIDSNDNTVNAGASFWYVEVSQGLINYKKEIVQTFVLAHEVAHIVTINQAIKFGLGYSIPTAEVTNDYRKSEYLADLIAFHLISINHSEQSKLLRNDFVSLKSLLGSETYTHPSGLDRIELMNAYYAESNKYKAIIAFKNVFTQIWDMN